ncbi:hypothetical protein [Guptibacillus hwajinpoensis]|uniref:hypothetical protein n=1 Tax=Guptibacillus hwajinpoensis TaxID=208199 RepID=UPI00273DF027|nr:hypothetical protein [Pseudalkalibacillus hwajinpoensis]WLR61937.1 hypothetical protein LC071_09095 [Pseudalkalibacillus hwajinpoensis]
MLVKLLEKIQLTVGVLFLVVFFITIIIQVITRYMGGFSYLDGRSCDLFLYLGRVYGGLRHAQSKRAF